MNRENISKMVTAAMAAAVAFTPMMSVPVFAAKDSTNAGNNTATSKDLADSDIIDMSKKGSLTIHKYDITAAQAAGDYSEGTRDANGQNDSALEDTMKDYGIQGVQFTYLRVGNIETYSNTQKNKDAAGPLTDVNVVYEIPTKLAEILKLKPGDAYDMNAIGVSEKCTKSGVLHYDSTQLTDALAAILEADPIAASSALEEYLYSYGLQDLTDDNDVNTDESTSVKAVNMPKTDANGTTSVSGLELGLYLVVETEVPEMVTDTTNPWFVSLPFTNMTGNSDAGTEGGDYWLYDMVVYPKNQTGNPTLDKSVRNAYSGISDKADRNGVVSKGDPYQYDVDSGKGNLIVYNDDTNHPGNEADTDPATYVANRGGYTKDGVTAGKDGAGYSYDYSYRDTNTASAGDIVDFILVSKLPRISSKSTFLSEYTFVDILSQGLTYNDDVQIAFYDNSTDANANNTKNAIATWASENVEFTDKYAEVTVAGDSGSEYKNGAHQMEVRMTEDGLNFINGNGQDLKKWNADRNAEEDGHDGRSDGSMSDMYMVVYYTACVNSDASLILGDEGNPNDVVLTWSRTSDGYYNTLEDENFVYSYSIDLTKRFSDEQGEFDKVQFVLYNETDAYYVMATDDDGDGVYYVTGKTMNKEDATKFVPNKETGKLVIVGLEADTYGMTEITTDDGYTLLEDSIKVAITPTDRDIQASVAGTIGLDAEDVDAIVAAYWGGIYNEDHQLVNVGRDELFGNDTHRPAVTSPNGRTIGKTDMYVGEIKPATAKVDDVDADMKEHVHRHGESTTDETSVNATVVLDVVNHKNFVLPATGGYGTILCTLAGCVAAVTGVVIITKKSKKKSNK